MTLRRSILITLATAFTVQGQIIINAVSAPTGGFSLAAGGCLTKAVAVTGATTTGMTVTVAPRTFPGDGVTWFGYVSAANTVTVKVCSIIAGFVSSSVYDINLVTGGNALVPQFVPAFQTGTSDAICALGADTITGLACQTTSATVATPFTTTVTIPANALNANTVPVNIALGTVTPATSPVLVVTIKLDSVPIFVGLGAVFSGSSTATQLLVCQLIAPAAASGSAPVIMSCVTTPNNPFSRNSLITPSAPSVAVATNTSHTLSVSLTYATATAGNAAWLESISRP